jgi:hypothetical protein
VGGGVATVTVPKGHIVRITVGHPIKLASYPSEVVRILTVVVVVGAFGLFARKLPFAFQYEYQPEDSG